MRSHWITYQGKRILYCDYSGYSHRDTEKFKAEMDAVVDVIRRQPENSVLTVADVRGSVASPEAVAIVKHAATMTNQYIRRQAVLGVTGIKKILFDAIIRILNQPARAFGDSEEDEEAAKQWVVEED
jgi:hypothetical protein